MNTQKECIDECELNEDKDRCLGCGRTLNEIKDDGIRARRRLQSGTEEVLK